ncbi:MAG TPA: hypothetical protein EYN66_24795 [Myxococcales bacterium]|nr:hypothetical protein [Myxococcales bacterium]
MKHISTLIIAFSLSACLAEAPEGVKAIDSAATTVKMDFFHRPLPEIPLPNDIATRYDSSSPTLRRVNASMVAHTEMEIRVRQLVDELDGWGVFMPIFIPFTGPLDINSILAGHRDEDYRLDNDVIYLVNIDRDSDSFGTFMHLDMGNGNYPTVLEDMNRYWANDPRGWTNNLMFEETDEDINKNGVLDPGEDTDADGILDVSNYLPGHSPEKDDLAGRADALMSFYERETNTIIVRPMIPLDERTTYAVVVTKRLKDEAGNPVGSPYPFINHNAQTLALEPLNTVLKPVGLSTQDVAFAWTFTTQSIQSNWQSIRDGLYKHGIQAHLGEEYPAEIAGFEPLRDVNHPGFKNITNPHILPQEDWDPAFQLIAQNFLGAKDGSVFAKKLVSGHQYIDYQVIGYYDSPQLFERWDDEGKMISLSDQSWPPDLTTKPAKTRSERIWFHLIVPRKEISARGEGKPAPLLVLGHGYGANRFDVPTLGGYLARHGMAIIGIDCISHGIAISQTETQQAIEILNLFGLGPFFDAVVNKGRAFDQNNDGSKNSGGDFWTSYVFHTRDAIRQSALDYMNLIRIIRSFDGTRRWKHDLNGDGESELAGDFDGDGVIDVGGDAFIGMFGASLGGIMSSVVSALEPEISVTVPIASGGALLDIGARSFQGGVPEAVILRMMGPLYLGTQTPDDEQMRISTIVPNVNSAQELNMAAVGGVQAGDFVVVENLRNGVRGCSYVADDNGTLRWRAAADSNNRDPVRILFYEGDAMLLGSKDCETKAGVSPRKILDSFEQDVWWQGQLINRFTPLHTLAEGLGIKRVTPRMRRFLAIGQMVLDNGDPAVFGPGLGKKPVVYAGTGQKTGANALVVTTVGDMNVPANGGITQSRAAGFIDYLNPDPRYGKPANQVLIDTYTAEAVHTLKRFTDSDGNGIHMDVENFSGGTDIWGDEVPRLDPPLRLGMTKKNASGGYSASIFPYPIPTGQHGFPFPGVLIDEARKICSDACAEGEDCECDKIDATQTFDVGSYLFNMFGRFLSTNGTELPTDMCMSLDNCSFLKPAPEPREPGQ